MNSLLKTNLVSSTACSLYINNHADEVLLTKISVDIYPRTFFMRLDSPLPLPRCYTSWHFYNDSSLNKVIPVCFRSGTSQPDLISSELSQSLSPYKIITPPSVSSQKVSPSLGRNILSTSNKSYYLSLNLCC